MLLCVIIENSEKIFHHFGMPEKLDFFFILNQKNKKK